MARIGLNTWLYGSFPAWTPSYTLEDAITHIDDAGFDSIEIGAASPHAWPQYMDEERKASIQEQLDESDLTVSTICPALGGGPGPNPASPLEVEREAAREHYLGCINVADAFGGLRSWDERRIEMNTDSAAEAPERQSGN